VKKSIVIILAVAIIGALGIYGKSSGSTAKAPNSIVSAPASTTPSSTISQTTPNTSSAQTSSSAFKDGTFTGDSEDTFYGNVQIAVVVSGGKITDINFLQMPNDLRHSQEVTAFSAPLLKEETIQKQSAHVDFVTGATQTSEGYQQSLQSALNQAV
jgi:uncharacterized protein with FMN-binding domain